MDNLTQFNNSDLMSVGLNGQITEEGVRELLMKIEKENIINSHKFSEKRDKEGYYRAYVRDPIAPKGWRQLRDKNLENLKERVYNFVKEVPDSRKIITFKDAFEYAQKFELDNVSAERRHSKQNTIAKNASDYARFFSGTSFESKEICEIMLRDIDMVVRSILKKLNLSKKGMESIRGIINLAFKRALYMGWITSNPAERIIWKDYKKLLKEPTAIVDRAYSEEELRSMMDYVHDYQARKPRYVPAYALEFQMLTAMRRGEISPLLWDDVDFENGTIYIHRELISQQNKREEGETIVGYTKNGKARLYPLADLEIDLLIRLKRVHDECWADSPFLFPANTSNGCITNNTVYQFFRRMCNKLGITVSRDRIRGTHAFRRTAITEAVNNSNGNCVLAAQMFGNSPETIRKHYYVGEDIEELRDVLNKRTTWDKTESESSSYILPFSSYKSENDKTPKTLKNQHSWG